eukprot:scaffold70433_cov27-Tisochrysis_lutea.AAC.5
MQQAASSAILVKLLSQEKRAWRRAVVGLSCVVFVLLIAMCVISIAVAIAFKDAYTMQATLVDSNATILKVASAEYQVPLIVAPILPLATLETVQTMTLTIPDPTGAQ